MPSSNGAPHGRAARWAIGLAAGAVLAGHGLTYAIVHPDGHERAGLLASTGHAYLHLLDGPGLVLALASALAAVLVGLGRLGHAPDRVTLFRRLAVFQVVAFVGMEIAERIASGAPLGTAGDAVLLAVGIAVQLALAGAGAWLLGVLHRGGERLARSLAAVRLGFPRPALAIGLPPSTVPAGRPAFGPAPGRGPPPRRR
jgi:hypothetical protein